MADRVLSEGFEVDAAVICDGSGGGGDVAGEVRVAASEGPQVGVVAPAGARGASLELA